MLSSVNDRSIDARRRHTPASSLPSASSPRELSVSPPHPPFPEVQGRAVGRGEN